MSGYTFVISKSYCKIFFCLKLEINEEKVLVSLFYIIVLDLSVLHSYVHQINKKTLIPNIIVWLQTDCYQISYQLQNCCVIDLCNRTDKENPGSNFNYRKGLLSQSEHSHLDL